MITDPVTAGWDLGKGLLPYYDPRRRADIRRRARALVTCTPWPGDAASSQDIAQLCLLRLLRLQRETHAAGRLRQSESAALLARTAIETAIVGLYMQSHPEAVAGMRAANARSIRQTAGFLADSDVVTAPMLDALIASSFPREDVRGLPPLVDMAASTSNLSGDQTASDLYRRFYVPMSTFFAHASAQALLRHVTGGGAVSERPSLPWTLRAALHAVDSCVGTLTASMTRDSAVAEAARAYAVAHQARAYPPVAVLIVRGMRGRIAWAQLPAAIARLGRLRHYYHSSQFHDDAPGVRRARVRDGLAIVFSALGPFGEDPARDVLLEMLTDRLAGSNDGESAT